MSTAPVRPRTLTEALRALTPAALTGVVSRRMDLAYPLPRDMAELATRSTTATSVGRAMDQLNAWLRVVAEALASLPDPSSVDAVTALLPQPPALVAEAVEELRRQALVWGEDDQLHLVRSVRETFEPYPGGLAPPSARPLAPTEIQRRLAECGPDIRPVLDRLLYSPTGAVRQADRPVSVAAARTPVEQLLARQLLRPVDADTVMLPREVAWEVRGGRLREDEVPATAPEVTGRPRTTTMVDRAAAGAGFGLLHDVELLARTVESTPHRLLRTGGLAARDVTALSRALGNDAAYAVFVVECAAAAGLVAAGGGVLLPTSDYDRWLAQDGATRWRLLADAWLSAERLFSRSAESAAHALGPEAEATAAPALRRTVLDLAWGAGAGTVVELPSLAAATAWHRPRLTRGPLSPETLVEWTWREGAWLGLVALGAVSSFTGALLAGPLPPDLTALFPEPVEQIIIQADLTAVAPGPLAHTVAAELYLLADQESRGGGGVYRFSAGSVRRAFDFGWSAVEIHDWLERHSSTGIPQPLAYLVDDVARRHGTIRVGPAGSFIRADDHAQLAALLAHPQAASLGLRSVAPGLVIAAVEEHELVALLREVGLTPAVEDAQGQVLTAPPQQRAARPRPEPRPATLTAAEVAAAVLAAERAHPVRRARGGPTTAESLDRLRTATADATPVRVAYVDPAGAVTERDLSPLDLGPGTVRAVDRANAQIVTIPLSRISSVTPVPRRR